MAPSPNTHPSHQLRTFSTNAQKSSLKLAAKEEAIREQQKRISERTKSLSKALKAAPTRDEDAMDVDEEEGERQEKDKVRARGRPRSAGSVKSMDLETTSTRSRGNSRSKSKIKTSSAGKRKSVSPVERLTKKLAIEDASNAIKARSDAYSPLMASSSSAFSHRKISASVQATAPARGRGIPSKRLGAIKQVQLHAKEEEEEEEKAEEEEEVVIAPWRSARHSVLRVSALTRRRVAVPLAASPQSYAGRARADRPRPEEELDVAKEQATENAVKPMGVLLRLGYAMFRLVGYAVVILTVAFTLHLSFEAYHVITPLCFYDSYGDGKVLSGQSGKTCKTVVPCPPLLLCHGGQIRGLAGMIPEKVDDNASISSEPQTEVPEHVKEGLSLNAQRDSPDEKDQLQDAGEEEGGMGLEGKGHRDSPEVDWKAEEEEENEREGEEEKR